MACPPCGKFKPATIKVGNALDLRKWTYNISFWNFLKIWDQMKINYMVLSSLSLVNKSTMHLGPLLGPTESSATMNSSSGCKMDIV
jgi:hypothetical protein